MLRIFIGYDVRQPVAYNVLQHSIISRESSPVSITPLMINQLPITRTGLTQFTYSRFLVPYLCDFKGWALFLDADMLVNTDISELFDFCDERYAVMLVQNKLRFEWSSLMLFNCERCKVLTPDFVQQSDALYEWFWLNSSEMGALPATFNHLVGYDLPNPDAKIIHYTKGMPCYTETKACEHSSSWQAAHRSANQIAPLAEILGKSVHQT